MLIAHLNALPRHRMESHGFPGCVHISEDFVNLLISEGHSPRPFIAFGEREIKGRGKMKTFLTCYGEWRSVISSALLDEESPPQTRGRTSFHRLPNRTILNQQSSIQPAQSIRSSNSWTNRTEDDEARVSFDRSSSSPSPWFPMEIPEISNVMLAWALDTADASGSGEYADRRASLKRITSHASMEDIE